MAKRRDLSQFYDNSPYTIVYQRNIQKVYSDTNETIKMFYKTAIADRKIASLSNYSHLAGAVNRYTDPTFLLTATAVNEIKGHAFNFLLLKTYL